MTHKDIFTKFMIEYDKANVTSSYPSLTEYEIATFLDKAYMALIAQKVTGNNVRRAPFEADIKSISDLQPLVTTINLALDNGKTKNPWHRVKKYPYSEQDDDRDELSGFTVGQLRYMPDNVRSTTLPSDFLYFVAASIPIDMHRFAGWMNDVNYSSELENQTIHPMDNKLKDYREGKYKRYRYNSVQLTSHLIAKNFFASSSNIPWVKNPVCYLEENNIFVVCDPIVGIPNLYYPENTDASLWVFYIAGDGEGSVTYHLIKLNNGRAVPEEFIPQEDQFYGFHLYDSNEDENKSDDLYYKAVVLDKDHLFLRAGGTSYNFKSKATKTESGKSVHYDINGRIDNNGLYITIDNLEYELDYIFADKTGIGDLTIDGLIQPEERMSLTYIKKPNVFVKENLTEGESFAEPADSDTDSIKAKWNFELDDIAAEELVSLAISYALENVESPRLNAHVGMRGLES